MKLDSAGELTEYGGLKVDQAKRLNDLERKSMRPKKLVGVEFA